MARYNAEHKDATRARIVGTAGRRFKSDGLDGSGVTALMADAGLTNGAFYAHFASKNDLIATVVADQLAGQYEALLALPADKDAVRSFVDRYLSAAHRDGPADGCPSAALLDEIARCDEVVQAAYTAGLERIVDFVATRLNPSDPATARLRAINLFSSMIACLQLARAVNDPQLSDQILEAGRAQAVGLVH